MLSRKELECTPPGYSAAEYKETALQLAEWLERTAVKADDCSCPAGDYRWSCRGCREAIAAANDWLEAPDA